MRAFTAQIHAPTLYPSSTRKQNSNPRPSLDAACSRIARGELGAGAKCSIAPGISLAEVHFLEGKATGTRSPWRRLSVACQGLDGEIPYQPHSFPSDSELETTERLADSGYYGVGTGW